MSHHDRLEDTAAHWADRLTTLATQHHVPGAQLGILRLAPDGSTEQVVVPHGVLSLRTGSPTTTDSLFQIGSITKVWTATVVMQLVDAGRLELDTPVAEVLPDLRLSDPEVTRTVTIRHLLTHTSGIDGDVFTDTGRGDECLERYVALLADVAQNHPLGRHVVLLQRRLLGAGAGHRAADRHDLGRGVAGAAVHAAGADPHRDAARGGAAVRHGRGARRGGRTTRPG